VTNGGVDDNPELRQINLVRQVKTEKEQQHSSSAYKHVGFKVRITYMVIMHKTFSYQQYLIYSVQYVVKNL
jgi:hypothetical protein